MMEKYWGIVFIGDISTTKVTEMALSRADISDWHFQVRDLYDARGNFFFFFDT